MFANAQVLRLRVLLFAVLIALVSLGVTSETASAQGAGSYFTTFDAPAAGTNMYQGSFATAIDANGNVAGIYLDASNNQHAFVRSAGGTLTSFDVGSLGSNGTAPIAFDGSGNLMGAYLDSSKVVHGFLRAPSSGTITSFDVPGAGTGKMQGTFPVCINASGVIGGIYVDANNIAHAFVRKADTTIVAFDAATLGSKTGKSNPGTYISSIDAGGDVAGSYMDAANVVHGFIRTYGGTITTFDAPNAGTSADQGTAVIGIDTAGDTAGFYLDANNGVHGFVRTAGANGVVTSFDAPGVGTGSFMNANGGPGSGTFPTAMDAGGDVGGTYMDANQMVRGFVRLANGTMSTFAAPGATPMANVAKHGAAKADALGTQSSKATGLLPQHGGALGFLNRTRNVLNRINGITAQGTAGLAGSSFLNGTGNQYYGTVTLGNLGFNGMNASGSIVGMFTDGDAVAHGFVRTANGSITVFDAPGAGTGSLEGTGAFAINASGIIVGAYADLNSVIHAYVLKLAQGTTTTTLSSNPSSSVFGQAVTLTATVSSTAGVVPDGETVWFMDGTTTLGSQTLSGGTAALTTTTLPGGTDSITAIYVGDVNFSGSTSATDSQVVSKASSTTTLQSNKAATTYGQAVIFTAAVAGQMGGKATGTVTFSAGSTVLGTVTVVGNAASLTTTALSAGSDSVTASYNGDGNFNSSTSTAVAQTVTKATPGIAWVPPAAVASGTALSPLQLNAVAQVPGSFLYNPAQGTVVTASQTLGVTFTPTDISDYTTATASVSLTVNATAASTPTVKVTPSSLSITTAQALSVTVTVSGASTAPTGSAVLSGGGYTSNAQILGNGITTFEIPAGWLAVGSDTLTATYSPDASSIATYKGASGNSAAVAVASAGPVTGTTTTTLAVTSAGSPVTTVTAGSVVTLTATVKAGTTAIGTGLVKFCDVSGAACSDIHLLGTAQLVAGGTATFKFRPGQGDHSFKAVFAGTKTNPASASTVSMLTVSAASGAGTPVMVGIAQTGTVGNYSLYATVGGFGPTAPKGNLSFLDSTYGNAVLGKGALNAGPAGLGFVGSPLTSTNGYVNTMVVGDFNGDGIPDVAIENADNNQIAIFLGNGDGTFTQAANSPVSLAGNPMAMTVGDFNGDGAADLAVVTFGDNGINSVTILLGNGTGTFTAAAGSPSAVGYQATSIAVGDFNGDGIQDLAVTNGYVPGSTTGYGTVTILLGNGSGAFTQAPNSPITVGSYPQSVVVGDFNRDGFADLAVANSNSGSVTVLLGSGTGTFTQATNSPISVGYSPDSIAVGDFNGDGVLDLAVAGQGSSTLTILQGNGNGTFTANASSPSTGGSNTMSVVAGDFNGDGIPDLAVLSMCGVTSCNNGVLQILLGGGDGTFGPATSAPTVLPSNPRAAVLSDFNGDGVPDLALTENYGSSVAVLLTASQTATASVSGIAVSGVGPHQAVASFNGDSNYKPGVSAGTSLYAPSPAPTFSLASGTYTSVQVVKISDAIPGATIYYTTEGYAPVINGGAHQYMGPITVSSSEVVQAMVVAPGYAQSPTVSATYTLSLPAAAIPVISPASGTFNQAITVTITEASPEAQIYYTTNGSVPTQNSNVYTGPFTVSTSETVEAMAMGGGYSASPVASAQYLAGSSATPFIYSVAGDGAIGYRGDGGPALLANLNNAVGTAVDSAGNLYIADANDNRVRKVAAGTGIITTVAGNGTPGYSGDGYSATGAQLNGPQGLAVDSAGNLYIADAYNGVIRKVTTFGAITTVLGNGTEGSFCEPFGVAVDRANNIFVADPCQAVIWKATASTSTMAVYAGQLYQYNLSGDQGAATSATLSNPVGLALDSAGNLYIADNGNNDVRMVNATSNTITTVAGPEYVTYGYQGDGFAATSALLNGPESLAVDSAGNLYIDDQYNNVIRKVTKSTGIITTMAGNGPSNNVTSGDGGPATSAGLYYPSGLSIDSAGNLYEAEPYTYRVREITAASLPPATQAALPAFSVAAGSYSGTQTVRITDSTPGASIYVTLDGTAPTTASDGYNGPISVSGTVTIKAIAVAPGYLQSPVATAAYTITSTPTAIISTVAGTGVYGMFGAGGPATSAQLGGPFGVTLDSAGNLYIPDADNNVVWKVAAKTGIITIVAGNGTAGFSGDNGPATRAQLYWPRKVAVDAAGNLYIVDRFNQVIRKVAATTGIITTFAGTPNANGYTGDGGLATSAKLSAPDDVAFDSAGNLYIADSGNCEIRMVNPSTGIISTVVGSHTRRVHSGDGGPASSAGIVNPATLAFDSAYNLYVVESFGRIRKIAAGTGIISTIAGTGEDGYTGDGGSATNAEIWTWGLAADPAGSLYLTNYFGAVRMISPSTGIISTVVGSGLPGYSGDGGSAGVAGLDVPNGIVFDPSGNLYIADVGDAVVRKVTFIAAPAPSLSLLAGRYATAQPVTITDSAPGAVIYYTTDGSTPTTASTVYSGPVTVSANETLSAVAIATGYSTSAPTSAVYKIGAAPVPTITWNQPAPITYGTPLSGTQLDATSTVAGNMSYNPQSGTVLGAGLQTLTATLTPTDTLNWANGTATVQLTVNKAGSTTTLASSLNPSAYSQSVTLTATVVGQNGGTATGTVTFFNGSTNLGTAPVNSGVASLVTTAIPVGLNSVTAAYSGDANLNAGSSTALTQTVNKATSGTTLASSLNPSAAGQSVTFTATVTGQYGGTAIGLVTFNNGSTNLGSIAPTNGVATLTTAALPVGTDSITAVFAGDSNLAGSTSTTLSQVVNKAGSTTTMRSSPNPSTFGQSVTLTATVTVSGPVPATGTVTFSNGGTSLGSATVSGGTATLATTALPVGTDSVTATYNGDANFTGSTSSVTSQTVNKASSNTSLASTPNPSGFGQAVTLTATVTGQNGGTATGTVTFNSGSTNLGSSSLNSGGVAVLTTSVLPAGAYSITAVYAGDTNFGGSTSSPVGQGVNKASSTTSLTSSPNPSASGQAVTLTATVAGQYGGTATGTVTFSNGGTTLGTASLASGVASLVTSALPVGADSIKAVYAGDANFIGSSSAAVGQTVNKASSTTSLTSSPNPSAAGQSVTFTATVTGQYGGTATGLVTFNNGSTSLGSIAPTNGVATLTTGALPVGTDSITAVFAGDSNLAGSTSATLSQVVNKASSTTALKSSLNPSAFGQSVTLTATVTVAGAVPVTGTVTFSNGSTSLGSGTLSGGTATLATTALPVGTDSVTAVYSGDANFTGSTSTALSQVVNKASSTTAAKSSTNPTVFGQPVTLTATVTGQNGGTATGTVTFSNGSTSLGTASLSAGTAVLTTAALPLGTDAITAVYAGDANFAGSSAAAFNQTVNQASSTTALTSSANPSAVGQSVNLTAVVTGQFGGTATGTVTFSNGSTSLGTATLNAGTAVLATTALPQGTDAITAVYAGDSNFTGSTSNTLSQSVVVSNPVPVVTGISPAIASAGSATFSLTVTGSGFMSGSTVYWGTSALTTTYGSATQLTAQVPAADIASAAIVNVTVQSPTPGGGTSNNAQFEVDSPTGTTDPPTFGAVTQTVTAGTPASYPVTLPAAVESATVTCLNLPTGATCSYSATTNAVTITTSATTPKGNYVVTVVFTETLAGAASGLIALPFLLLPLAFMRKKLAARGVWTSACLGLILLAGAAFACVACGGGGSSSSTPPPNPTHQVTTSTTVGLKIQ